MTLLIHSIVKNIEINQRIKLKKKARIHLEDSAFLIGVVDDQGILEENEIFV